MNESHVIKNNEHAMMLLPSEGGRNMSITAITLNRDEPTLFESISSIIHMVDKLVLIDASKDKTLYHEVIASYPNKIVARETEANIKTQSRLAHSLVDTRWILRWDADFIAKPELEYQLDTLTSIEGQIGISFYCRDERSNRPDSKYGPYHRETYLFTNSPKFGTPHLKKRLGTLAGNRHSLVFSPFPFEYTLIALDKVLILHKDIKPEWRKAEKPHQIAIARSTT